MFEGIRLKLRGYHKQPFAALELLDCKEREEQFYITVVETDGATHEWAIEPWAGDDIIEIHNALMKEPSVLMIVFSDYKNKLHYWRVK